MKLRSGRSKRESYRSYVDFLKSKQISFLKTFELATFFCCRKPSNCFCVRPVFFELFLHRARFDRTFLEHFIEKFIQHFCSTLLKPQRSVLFALKNALSMKFYCLIY